MRKFRLHFCAAVVCLVGLVVTGCGSSDSESNQVSTATSDGNVSQSSAGVIEAAIGGSFGKPLAKSPRPEPGKNLWFIPITAGGLEVNNEGGLLDAAEEMGWKLTEFDGKFSPDTIVTGIRQAVASGADGIMLYVIDCPNVRSALEDAHEAGVKIVAAESYDCNEVNPGAPALFDATARYVDPGDPSQSLPFSTFIKDVWAKNQALAIINGTEEKAKLIDLYESDLLITVEQDKGLRKALAKYCQACEIVDTVTFTGADVGPPLQQQIEQALVEHPEANAIVSPYDAITQVTMGALQASGRAASVYSVGAVGEKFVIEGIRDGTGTVDAGVGLSPDWELYSMLDAMNRLFHEETDSEMFITGNGAQIFDAENNLPPMGERYQPPVDFRAAYRSAWGLE